MFRHVVEQYFETAALKIELVNRARISSSGQEHNETYLKRVPNVREFHRNGDGFSHGERDMQGKSLVDFGEFCWEEIESPEDTCLSLILGDTSSM